MTRNLLVSVRIALCRSDRISRSSVLSVLLFIYLIKRGFEAYSDVLTGRVLSSLPTRQAFNFA
jgi:hypothetical protein